MTARDAAGRWVSCLVHTQPTDAWGADEVVLLVTVRRPSPSGSGTDNGQALILARYRHPVPDLAASLSPITAALEQSRIHAAEVARQVEGVNERIRAGFSAVAFLSSGSSASNALGNILAIVEEIRKEV